MWDVQIEMEEEIYFHLPSDSSYSTWYQSLRLLNLERIFLAFIAKLKIIVGLHCQLDGFLLI